MGEFVKECQGPVIVVAYSIFLELGLSRAVIHGIAQTATIKEPITEIDHWIFIPTIIAGVSQGCGVGPGGLCWWRAISRLASSIYTHIYGSVLTWVGKDRCRDVSRIGFPGRHSVHEYNA